MGFPNTRKEVLAGLREYLVYITSEPRVLARHALGFVLAFAAIAPASYRYWAHNFHYHLEYRHRLGQLLGHRPKIQPAALCQNHCRELGRSAHHG